MSGMRIPFQPLQRRASEASDTPASGRRTGSPVPQAQGVLQVLFTAAVLDVFEVDMETLNPKVRKVPEIDMA